MRRLLLLLALILPLFATQAAAAPVTFEFVCQDVPVCDGDTAFSLKITLDSGDIVPNGTYLATYSNAGFSWSATSSVGNGFSISGTMNALQVQDLTDPNGLLPPPPGVLFTFDNAGALSTVTGVYENSSSMSDGISFKFANQVCSNCYTLGGYVEWVEPNKIGARVDGYTGGSIGRVIDDTDIVGVWQRVQASSAPEPASIALVGLGLFGMALTIRRRR